VDWTLLVKCPSDHNFAPKLNQNDTVSFKIREKKGKAKILQKRKAKKDPELPKFEWKLFEKEKKLDCGVHIPRKIQTKTRKSGYQKE
jgi:hypothetical protein